MSKSILLADDNNDSRIILAKLLTKSGYSVDLATSFEGAKTLLGSKSFDILICDLNLGDDDCLKLRPLHVGLAIVVSGACLESDKAKTMSAGFNAHLAKPLDLNRLLFLIESHEQK